MGPGTSWGEAGNRASVTGEPRCYGDGASAASPVAFDLEGISHRELHPHVSRRARGAIRDWPPGMTPKQNQPTKGPLPCEVTVAVASTTTSPEPGGYSRRFATQLQKSSHFHDLISRKQPNGEKRRPLPRLSCLNLARPCPIGRT